MTKYCSQCRVQLKEEKFCSNCVNDDSISKENIRVEMEKYALGLMSII